MGRAQTEDITDQLNDGIRDLDIRVKYSDGGGNIDNQCFTKGYYAQHGVLTACSLSLGDIFTQIDDWTNTAGHEREIIVVGLSIDQNGGFQADVRERQDCEAIGTALGSALLTPSRLEAAGYSADPGQVTLGQLWAMPGHPRVILSEDTCMDAADPGAGKWDPDPPFGSGPGQSYYANQCWADTYSEWWDFKTYQMPGITQQVELAADTRAIQGGGDDTDPGNPVKPGPSMQGGLWTLFLQATPTVVCLKSLADFDLTQQDKVLAALYKDWSTFDFVKANVNIIAGDFVQDSDLVKDALAMDETYPEVPGAIAPVGADQVKVPLSDGLVPAAAFAAQVTDYTGAVLPGAQVTYQISGPAANLGFGPKHAKTATVKSDAEGDINPGDALRLPALGALTGTWTVTATGAGGTHATWTLTVVPSTGAHLVARSCPCSGQVNQLYHVTFPNASDGSFEVEADDANGNPVLGVPVTFDAGSAGTFTGGSTSVTDLTRTRLTGPSTAIAPAFTPGTQAGTFSISISSPGADNTLSLPFTANPGPLAGFKPTQGDGQSTPVNTKFPIALKGHWTDLYGNQVAPPSGSGELTLDPDSPSGGTWPNGKTSVEVKPDADGTITAPDLTAGNTVLNNGIFSNLAVFSYWQSGVPLNAWRLYVTPGPPTNAAAISGGRQQTAVGNRFANPLAVKITDARGHPVAGVPVIFKVTSGKATFGRVNLHLAAGAVIGSFQALLKRANPPRDAVTEPTNAHGVATTPVLTAGTTAGPIAVTASVGTSGKIKVVFHPSVVTRRRHPSARTKRARAR